VSGIDVLARTLPSLLLIVGALLVLRHWAQRGSSGQDAGLRVISRTGLAKGAVVAVVAVGDRRLLVGASEHGVALLSELEPEAGTVPSALDLHGTEVPTTVTTDAVTVPDLASAGLRPRVFPWSTDRPRMAPIDRLRHLTVRRAVPSHPRRPNGALRRT
jgi:hypothetical protein